MTSDQASKSYTWGADQDELLDLSVAANSLTVGASRDDDAGANDSMEVVATGSAAPLAHSVIEIKPAA